MTLQQSSNTPIPSFVKKAVFIASLGGILFGYDMGVISGALPQLTNEFNLSDTKREMIVSFLFLGGAIGSTVGGTICDITGRKKAILITDITFIIGAIQLFISQSFIQILIGRVIIGFAVAVSGIADVSYLHEISPVEWRGAIVSVNEACISLGFLVSYVAGYGISQLDAYDGWRYMFGLGSLIAVVQFGGMMVMPESPVWLSDHGKEEEAKAAMDLIHCYSGGSSGGSSNNAGSIGLGNNGNNRTFTRTIEDYGMEESSSSSSTKNSNNDTVESKQNHSPNQMRGDYASLDMESSISQSNQNDNNEQTTTVPQQHESICKTFLASYRQVIIAIFLSVMQQFCGHPNVLNYAPEIFSQLGVASLFSTLLVGVLKFGVTCFVILKIEHFGRRFLLLVGMSIIACSLLILTIAFSSQDEDGNLPVIARRAAVLGIFGVAGGYAASFGPLTWLLVSELFPSSIRGRALGLSTIITYLAGGLVSYTFLSVQDWFQPSAPFAIYFLLTLFSIIMTYLGIPDTAGKDPQRIQQDIEMMWLWKKDRSEYTPHVVHESSHRIV